MLFGVIYFCVVIFGCILFTFWLARFQCRLLKWFARLGGAVAAVLLFLMFPVVGLLVLLQSLFEWPDEKVEQLMSSVVPLLGIAATVVVFLLKRRNSRDWKD